MIAGVLEIQFMANMSRLSDDMRRTERVVGDSMTKVERSVASASRALSSLGLGVSIGLIADQMRRTADSFTKLDAQIRLSTKSQQQYNRALDDIRRISTISQSDISATTMLYTRLLNTTDGMGISQSKLATVTETVSYGLKAYGATSAEAASATLQLSQAIGANRLGGEEFRAVMEAMPNVMKVLAKSMRADGIGGLRALSIAGKITAAEIIKAFGDPAVAAEFKKMAERAQTITGAWTVARNELTLLFGEFAKSSGLTQGMIAAFNGLAGVLRTVAQYLGEITVLLGAWAALRVTQMVYGYVAALMAQRAAALAVAQAELARVNMTYGASAATVAAARSSYAYAAANATLGGSLLILGQRMAAFVAANSVAITLTSIAVAVVALKRDFDSVIDSVSKFQEKIRSMDVDALRAARQLEVANVAAMKSSIFSGFNERDILFAERRIRMMDAQIIAAEKLAKVDGPASPVGKDGKEHQSKMLRIAQDLQAQKAADAEKLTHSERVTLAWVQLKRKEQTAQEALNYVVAQEAAIELDNLEAAKKAAAEREALVSGISESIMRAAKSGNVGQAIRDDIQAAFEKEIVMPEVKVMVSAGVDWVKALVANTAATEKNTASTGGTSGSSAGGGWWVLVAMAFIAAVQSWAVKFENTLTKLTATAAGVTGRKIDQYSNAVNYYYGLSTKEVNMFNAVLRDSIGTFAAAGDVLGVTDIRTRDFKVNVATTGDAVQALTDAVGQALIPGLRMLSREGETLADTAKRVTETFKATNDFIVALGVSQGAAFGGFGLGSAAGRDALIAASGGLQSFTQNAQSFVKNFLTPAEQMAPALDAVGRTFARLGIEGVTTNEQFAALVKQQMELGNTDVVAQLLSVADSFNQVTKSAADANKELQALLKKELFSTLVDYIRATNAAGAGNIAAATSKAAEVIAKEQAGTVDFVANGQYVAPTTPPDLSQSGWSVMAEGFRDLIKSADDIFKMLRDIKGVLKAFVTFAQDVFGGIKTTLGDMLHAMDVNVAGLPGTINQFKTGLKALLAPMAALLAPLAALRDALNAVTGGGGGGGGGGLPLPPGLGGLFANGGVFTNGIYSSPTPFMFASGGGFSMGVMGEAGDEAVMPLQRGPDGRLGVSMNGGTSVAEEVRLLRAEVNQLRRDNQSGQIAIATSSQRTYKLLDRWNGEGLPAERVAG